MGLGRLIRPLALHAGDLVVGLRLGLGEPDRVLRAYNQGRADGRREALDEVLTDGFGAWVDLGTREAQRYANRGHE